MGIYSVDKLIGEARRIAREYREATGKTLPLTAEIAINDAIRLLDLVPAAAGETGYDAISQRNNSDIRLLIKGRAVFDPRRGSYRIGQLKLNAGWDAVVLVLMDAGFEAEEMYLAWREDIEDVLATARSNRGGISVARFKIIGDLVWSRINGMEDDHVWVHKG